MELQDVAQDEETDVLMGVREVRDEHSCDIMGDVRVLGTPKGRQEYVEDFLVRKSSEHDTLFTQILVVEDLQSGWLLLLMCTNTCEFLVADSQMTADHLRLILESEFDTRAFCQAAQDLARRKFLQTWWQCFEWAASQFLQKPSVLFAALCAETSCEGWWLEPLHRRSRLRFWKQRLRSSTRWVQRREESLLHMQSSPLTDMDSRATVLSIDGISAFDLISRAAMLDGMAQIRGGEAVLPFVLQFYSQPSQYLWTDNYGDNHVILQGEGSVSKEMPSCCTLWDSMVHCKRCKIL